jgi:hypothetical protein
MVAGVIVGLACQSSLMEPVPNGTGSIITYPQACVKGQFRFSVDLPPVCRAGRSKYETNQEITSLLINLAERTMWAVENKPQRPANFVGVGGMKVFRDLIYVMQGLMQEDHRFYRKHGLYDFPQKQVKRILQMKLIGLLLKSPKMRKKMGTHMNEAMLRQYTEVIDHC